MKAIAILLLLASTASAQRIVIGGSYGFGNGYYGGSPTYVWGGRGWNGGWGGGWGGNRLGFGAGYGQFQNPLNSWNAYEISNQIYQQQAAATAAIYQAQEKALIEEIAAKKAQVAQLDAQKYELYRQYLAKPPAEQNAERLDLMATYLSLSPHDQELWRGDDVAMNIIGRDLNRLEGVRTYRQMNAADQVAFRDRLRAKYQGLTPTEQSAWQGDPVLTLILGRDWWQR